MDLLNSLLDTGKKMASEALAQQAGVKAEQGADTFLSVLFETFNKMDATQKAQLLALVSSLVSQITGDKSGTDGIWEQFKGNPLVREWAGNLAQEAVKRLSSQLLS
jgi:hypothetical protein